MNRSFRHNLVSAGSRLVVCAMLTLPSAPSLALGLFGSSDEPPLPQITLARTQVAAEIPTPLQGNDMQALLAQAASGEGLAAARDAATRAFSEQLRSKLEHALRHFFAEEQVELAASDHSLTLHNFIDISIVKQLSGLKSGDDYELEKGNLSASGDFHFRLQKPGGEVLKERRLDIADLRIKASYQIKTYSNGQAAEDSTPAELEKLTDNLVARILDRIEDDLEADSLRNIAGG
ncbi:hypothetical protein GNX18_14240 [Microbulbifer sp. SH-1]|uniref:hypothetical protein n=1 Tax=Microbulbifer sp. SH-1 TaxID=2681547 RepID=UPI00140B30FA|nr:hypothetical protein [Microbulbifer sp. SH-1]QIL90800.1 hypothetical protein GNX18_14240 [Microbulbifer sp. SH-1]